MQLKTIERTIAKKLNEWLDSITNLELQKQVRENLLLSGGAITSMFLGMEVNDYDVYIKDMNVLKKLAEYYVKGQEITILDGREKGALLDKDRSTGSSHIAIENLKEDQIKLYFKGKPGVKIDNPEEVASKYLPAFFSANAISLTDNIQIVLRFHGDNEQIHKTFDFIHATNYFTFNDGLVTNKRALESIITKQLFYQGSLYPLTSIIRMKKFIKRGWNINAGEILKIMFQISELNLRNPNVLEEQLIGIDVAYFSKLIEILRGVEGKGLTSQYLNTIIDRVFNSSEEIE